MQAALTSGASERADEHATADENHVPARSPRESGSRRRSCSVCTFQRKLLCSYCITGYMICRNWCKPLCGRSTVVAVELGDGSSVLLGVWGVDREPCCLIISVAVPDRLLAVSGEGGDAATQRDHSPSISPSYNASVTKLHHYDHPILACADNSWTELVVGEIVTLGDRRDGTLDWRGILVGVMRFRPIRRHDPSAVSRRGIH
jgi:hypothetical protein